MDLRLLIICTVLIIGTKRGDAQIVINEIMQSNIDCVMDDLNEFPDSWVELYNSGTQVVNLKDYKMGISPDIAEAWSLPDQNVPAKGYILVYCDKEENGMHTSFRLESGKGGEIYLFHNGNVEDKITGLKKQPAPNIAYGRKTDGSSEWGYMAKPTPKSANCGSVCKDILGEPVFSETGKVMTDKRNITLTLSLPEGVPAGTEIRLTYDGTEPESNSILYTSPIQISATRTVRAKLFCKGYLSPRSTTQSYIFFPREMTLPVFSIVTNKKYFEDPAIGIYVDGNRSDGRKNYEFDWRRPINIEFFDEMGKNSVLNQLCETRIMGGATRGNAMKSLAVYANKRFGTKRLEYEFFPDQKPGVTDFKSICLRNAGNDFDYLYMRDAIIQRVMAQNADLDWQAWRPAVVFFNGTYKGMLNIRERSNDDNIYTNYDGLEDIDMFENLWELKAGDWENYNSFREFYNEHGHTMAEYGKWMDTREFMNLMIMNLYFNNQDFPGNNIVMWRPRTEGGRWRFIAKDTDFGLGLYDTPASYNTIQWLYDPNYDANRAWANQYEHTRLFRRLMEDGDFAREFIDRCAVYTGDFMSEEGVRTVWDPMYDMIKAEYPHHRKLINEWWPNYNEELSKARNWIKQRADYFYTYLANYYKLGTPARLTVNKGLSEDDLSNVAISANGIPLTKGTLDGKFFTGREMTLSAKPVNGITVKEWNICQTAANGATTTLTVGGDSYTFTMPACQSLKIDATLGIYDGIENISGQRQWAWTSTADGIQLSGLAPGTTVRLYNVTGMLIGSRTATATKMILPANPGQTYILRVNDGTVKVCM